MNTQLLAPAAVLVIWSLIMLVWLAGTRLPAAARAGINVAGSIGGRGQDLDAKLDPKIGWRSHNYIHLMEQPTLFYAVVIMLTIAQGVNSVTLYAAWGYTCLRIAHSLWQATVNKVSVRFVLFLLSTICLLILAVAALMRTL